MSFQDEMKQMFSRVVAGEAEPEEWRTWWNSHKSRLEEVLSRGDQGRIMPVLWSASYRWMAKTQKGVAYYFYAQGRPVKVSGYYEEKMLEEEKRARQKAMEGYHRDTACARGQWERYLKERPKAYNDPREPIAVMYRNAQLFVRTRQIGDAKERHNAVRETYEEVCRFMRYYHGLAKKAETILTDQYREIIV